MEKLTKKVVDIRKRPEKGQEFIWDSEVIGFGVRITAGSISFVAESRINGAKKRLTIGKYGVLTVEEAREQARNALALMSAGIDPHAGKKRHKASSITLLEALEVYIATKELRPSTKRVYQTSIKHAFADWLDKPISSISKNDCEDRHKEMTNGTRRNGNSGRAYANGAFKTLQAIINFTNEKYEVEGEAVRVNPVSRLTKTRAWYRVHPRTGVIPEYKLAAWYKAVVELPNATNRDYFLLLVFTGLRRREGTDLKWSEVDLEAKTLMIRRYQAKNHKDHVLPLSNFLFDLLKRRHDARSTNDYVFPGRFDIGHLTDFKSGLRAVRRKSGCQFLVHDTRRTFLSAAERLEVPYYVLKRLANHTITADTLTPYIVVSMERLREHMERISQHFQIVMGIEQSTEARTLEEQIVKVEESQIESWEDAWQTAAGS